MPCFTTSLLVIRLFSHCNRPCSPCCFCSWRCFSSLSAFDCCHLLLLVMLQTTSTVLSPDVLRELMISGLWDKEHAALPFLSFSCTLISKREDHDTLLFLVARTWWRRTLHRCSASDVLFAETMIDNKDKAFVHGQRQKLSPSLWAKLVEFLLDLLMSACSLGC